MPKIFELFGHRVDDTSPEAEADRKNCSCPFMGRDCDGGGNRYSSQIDLEDLRYSQELKHYFEGRETVPAGVCSIQPRESERPWIVCPRRLLVLGKEGMGHRKHQDFTDTFLLRHAGFTSGTKLGIWSEVKLRYATGTGRNRKSFDYTFDYILMPIQNIKLETALESTDIGEKKLRDSGLSVVERASVEYVEDFPQGDPLVVEVMTSSTSGGNKNKRTTVAQAFEDAILKGIDAHVAPGINYRQVWARMVSQLIVKSEASVSWGGKTIWVLQDVLADYISSSTALDLQGFVSEETSEVNILSFSYGDAYRESSDGVAELSHGELFAGPVRPPGATSEQGFQDMIRAPIVPPKSNLVRALASKRMVSSILVP